MPAARHPAHVHDRARRFAPDPMDTATREIVAMAAQGMSDREIARALDCSVRTVTRRFSDAMQAYGARSRFHLGYVVAATEETAGSTSG